MPYILHVICASVVFYVVLLTQIKGDSNELSTWRDEPVQLVKPDIKHKKLMVVEENIQLLHEIRGPVATVAVVGKFHSGKSFLLNQLMRKSSGFGFQIGPTVKPQTMGIWMWGKPLEIRVNSTIEKLSVIFLDTEGFAANNISEHYDAKIFAVATLLSSYLIYNSVKIIDQSDIDYLEILARRTQLFALRSQLSKSEWTNDFNRDLLSFPPLMWVVQDFVQTTDGFSPTEWLKQLMDTHSRENEDYEISLLGIFNQIDCHTLFLPATKKKLLIDLSKATENDLTEDYKMERDLMTAQLFNNLKPKEKNEKPITGVELANLLRILVTAANEGSLSDVPTRWIAFTQHLQTTATEDCLKFYDGELNLLHNQSAGQPIIPQAFKDWHNHSSEKTLNLLGYLLHGLDDALASSRNDLLMLMNQKFDKAFELNEKKIKLKCSELQAKFILISEEKYSELQLPIPSYELKRAIVITSSEVLGSFIKEMNLLISPEATDTQMKNLKLSMNNLGDSFQLRNNKAIEEFLNSAANKAKKKFEELTNIDCDEPQIPKSLNELIRTSTEHSVQLFKQMTEKYHEETSYSAFQALFKESLAETGKKIEQRNEALVIIKAGKRMKENVNYMEVQTSSEFISLPVQNAEFESRLKAVSREALVKFSQAMDDYKSYKAVLEEQTLKLKKQLDGIAEQRRKENVEAFTKEVSGPLKVAKDVIKLSADKYNTEFSLKQYMRKVCLLNLNEGKASSWPFELRIQIIDHFFQSDKELDEILKSRSGLWSSVVGFFQWILWVVGIAGDFK
ncbi:hypothetical protein CHUAL_009723 [Chamberlinius hualienensis]